MQRFVEADYYELDWYYDECADGKQRCSGGRGHLLAQGKEGGDRGRNGRSEREGERDG